MTLSERAAQLNESVALVGTKVFSSMWTAYAFCLWGLLGMMPGLPKAFTDIVLLVSSAWIQLWALPLLAVGAVVLNRASEARATQDHAAILEELALLHEAHDTILEELAMAKEERALMLEINQRLDTVLTGRKLGES
jgi:hypothetical protein